MGINQESWKVDFVKACESTYEELKSSWEENWRKECDGKKVLRGLHRRFETGISLIEFKRRVGSRMSENRQKTGE